MDDEDLVRLLVWHHTGTFSTVPSCDEGCEDFSGGCAVGCLHEKRERAVRKWLKEEA